MKIEAGDIVTFKISTYKDTVSVMYHFDGRCVIFSSIAIAELNYNLLILSDTWITHINGKLVCKKSK